MDNTPASFILLYLGLLMVVFWWCGMWVKLFAVYPELLPFIFLGLPFIPYSYRLY